MVRQIRENRVGTRFIERVLSPRKRRLDRDGE